MWVKARVNDPSYSYSNLINLDNVVRFYMVGDDTPNQGDQIRIVFQLVGGSEFVAQRGFGTPESSAQLIEGYNQLKTWLNKGAHGIFNLNEYQKIGENIVP